VPPTACPPSARVASWSSWLVAFSVAAYLLARTFVYPGVPVLLVGDQGFFWSYADRLLHGQLPYRDFFQFTPPGTDLMFAGAFALFGTRIWVTNAVVIALGTALGAVAFRIARQLMSDAEAALATAVFTVLVYGQALNATHHWWSVLGIMAAVSVLPPTFSARRLVAAGALVGLSMFFTQSHAVPGLVGIGAFTAWQGRREGLSRRATMACEGALLAGFLAVTLPAATYLVARAGIAPVWDSLVVYVWRYMRQPPAEWTFGLPEPLNEASVRWLAPYLVVYAIVPAAYVLTPAVSLGEFIRPNTRADDARVLCWLVGALLFAEILPGFNWVRLYAVALPAVILFVWAVGRAPRYARVAHLLVAVGTVLLACALVRSTYRNHRDVVDIPGGRVASNAKDQEKLPWLADHLRPGESVFLAGKSSLYIPLGLHNPLFLDAAVPGPQTAPAHVRRAIRDLDAAEVAHVLWSPALGAPQPGQPPEGVPALRAYVHARYHLEKTFRDGDELWERN
jgi:hypothetical protein